MKRSHIVSQLINEGFSEKTLLMFSDSQLSALHSRVVNENTKMIPKEKTPEIEMAKKNKETFVAYEAELKGGQKKLDKNHNGKLDSQDFKILRNKKAEVKEEKPSAGLSKEKKSEIVKKAKKGEDIGKKGKGFKEVEKSAKKSGAKDPKAVAASVMWKNIKENSQIDEAKHSTKELTKFLKWLKSKHQWTTGDSKDGITITPPTEDLGPTYWTHKSDKGVFDIMRHIAKQYGVSKKNVEDAYNQNVKIDEVKQKKEKKDVNEISGWVKTLAENNFHSMTSKGEIVDMIKNKLHEQEYGEKVKKGHNNVPEFMTYDAIVGGGKEVETPVKPKTTPERKTPLRQSPYRPGPFEKSKPKAGIGENKEVETPVKPKTTPERKTPLRQSPYRPGPFEKSKPKAGIGENKKESIQNKKDDKTNK